MDLGDFYPQKLSTNLFLSFFSIKLKGYPYGAGKKTADSRQLRVDCWQQIAESKQLIIETQLNVFSWQLINSKHLEVYS